MDGLLKRDARTYVRRRGRITQAQARALVEMGAELVVVPDDGWGPVFGRDAPLGVEIGFGMGHALLDWAARRTDWNLVGVDVYQPGIGSVLLGIEEQRMTNVRVVNEDARIALQRDFVPESVDEIRIFFPDPWPKKRHHKRRLIQPEFVSCLASRLKHGARLLLATDWQEYADWMVRVLDAEPGLVQAGREHSIGGRSPHWPWTRFEDRGRRLGLGVRHLCYVRNC